jgi:hypothetical protein
MVESQGAFVSYIPNPTEHGALAAGEVFNVTTA